MTKLSHTNKNGKVKMIDISGKETSNREATVTVNVFLNQNTFKLVQENQILKGDVLTTAKLAGIQAAKNTSNLIPLCHQINLSQVEISFNSIPETSMISITATARTNSATGVEMEAFCACSIAAVTIYDMVKAVQKDVIISDMKLLHKQGGKSGEYNG